MLTAESHSSVRWTRGSDLWEMNIYTDLFLYKRKHWRESMTQRPTVRTNTWHHPLQTCEADTDKERGQHGTKPLNPCCLVGARHSGNRFQGSTELLQFIPRRAWMSEAKLVRIHLTAVETFQSEPKTQRCHMAKKQKELLLLVKSWYSNSSGGI